MPQRMSRQGFTLVELLVVIGIIAVLSAWLFPLLTSVRCSARRVGCQSNLGQIAAAMSAYTADYDDCYPNINDPFLWMGRHWRWPMKEYLCFATKYDPNNPAGQNQITNNAMTVLACPSDSTPASRYDRTSYGYSACFYHKPNQVNQMTTTDLLPSGNSPPCFTVSESMVMYPSQKAIVTDWLASHTGDKVGWWSWQGSRNYLFVDGHVRFLGATSIRPAVTPIASVSRLQWPDINLTTNGVAGIDVD